MATAITPSFHSSAVSLVIRVFRRMWATGSTVGLRCIGSMLRVSSGWCSRRVPTGARYHAVEEGVPFRDIAGVIGRRLDRQVVAKSPAEAANHFGWFAQLATLDNPTSSERTRDLLGWQPKHPELIPDLDWPRCSRLGGAHKRPSVSHSHSMVLSHW